MRNDFKLPPLTLSEVVEAKLKEQDALIQRMGALLYDVFVLAVSGVEDGPWLPEATTAEVHSVLVDLGMVEK